MAIRGRKPKPAELRELQGNPGKRALPARRPRAATRRHAPPAPEWLGDHARREWHRMARTLVGMRVLTDSDMTALAAYCDAYGRWLQAREILNAEGLITDTGTGSQKVHPAWTIANQAMTQMRAFMVEFGLTPSSRTRVSVEAPAEKSEFEMFLERKGGMGERG